MSLHECCAPGCKRNRKTDKDKKKSFFNFPCEPVRCNKWLRFCGLEYIYKTSLDVNRKRVRICSDHFNETDYYSVHMGRRRKLNSTAVPSIYSNGTAVSQLASHSPISAPMLASRFEKHKLITAEMQQAGTAQDMQTVSHVKQWRPMMSSTGSPKATFGELHGSDMNMSAVATKGDHIEFDPLMLPEKLEGDIDEQSQTYQWIKCESEYGSFKTEEECVTDCIKQEPCSNSYSPEREASCIMKQELIIKQEDNDEEGIAQNFDRPEFVYCNENFSATSSTSVTQNEMTEECSAEFSPSSDTRDPLFLSYNYTFEKPENALSSTFSINAEEESSMEIKPALDERDPLLDQSGTNCTQPVNSGNLQDIAEERCSINIKSSLREVKSLQDVQKATSKQLEKESQPADCNKHRIYVQKTYSKKKSPLDKTYLIIDGQRVPSDAVDKESLLENSVNPQVKPPTFPVNKSVGTMEKKPNQTSELQRSNPKPSTTFPVNKSVGTMEKKPNHTSELQRPNLKPSRCKSPRVLALPLYKVNKDQVGRGIALSRLKVIMKKKPNQLCHPQEGNPEPSKNECVPPSSNQVSRGIALSGLKVIVQKTPNQIRRPQEANLKPSKNECVPLLIKTPSSVQVNRGIALSGIKVVMNKPNQICNPQEANKKPSENECVPPSSESPEIESTNSSTCKTSSKGEKMTVYEYKKMVRSLKESPENDNPDSFTHKTRSIDEKMTVHEYKKMVQCLKESSEFESPYSFTCKTSSKDGKITVYEYKKMVESLMESPEIDNPNSFTCKTSSKDGEITVYEYKKKVQSLMEKLPAVKLKRRCYVPGCTSNNTNSKLFAFPRSLERTCEWLQQIGINCTIEEAKDYAHKRTLCPQHFADDQYQTPQKRRLKSTAIPLSLSSAPSDDVGCPNES